MRIKKTILIILIGAAIGLGAGAVLEHFSMGAWFPLLLILGSAVGLCIALCFCAGELSAAARRTGLAVKHISIKTLGKSILRALLGPIIGLAAGAVIELVALGAWFPVFLLLGGLIGLCAEIVFLAVRYGRSASRAALKRKGLDLER